MTLRWVFGTLVLASCSSGPPELPGETDTDPNVDTQVPPTAGAALRVWLDEGNYTDWTAESGVHASTGPHFGDVRTFVNDALFGSLDAGAAEHPVGAAVVKELYGAGTVVGGFSVLVKVETGTTGDSWYWFERYEGSTFANGFGEAACVGCHSAGTDHVLTPFPLQ